MDSELQPAFNIEMESVEDLVRQVIGNLSPDRQPLAYFFANGEKWYLGTFFTVPDYFQYRGLPLFAYVKVDPQIYQERDFLRFDTRKERGKNLSHVKSIDEADLSTGYIQYVPVVRVKGKLPFLQL